jgi:hypothetical protein
MFKLACGEVWCLYADNIMVLWYEWIMFPYLQNSISLGYAKLNIKSKL